MSDEPLDLDAIESRQRRIVKDAGWSLSRDEFKVELANLAEQDVPALVAEVERLRGVIEQVRALPKLGATTNASNGVPVKLPAMFINAAALLAILDGETREQRMSPFDQVMRQPVLHMTPFGYGTETFWRATAGSRWALYADRGGFPAALIEQGVGSPPWEDETTPRAEAVAVTEDVVRVVCELWDLAETRTRFSDFRAYAEPIVAAAITAALTTTTTEPPR